MNRTRHVMIVALTCAILAGLVVAVGWPIHIVGASFPRLAPAQLGSELAVVPAGCVEHAPLDGGVDYSGDFHCAGMALNYHVAGGARSPYPIWAGQWLFIDPQGRFHRGLCTFNRGVHPTINAASVPVAQFFPNDVSGAKRAYLTWRYGLTSDDLTAAGLWAVFHYYAQDAAGTNRAFDPTTPLVSSLEGVAAASGRADIEAMALALDREAQQLSGDFTLDVELASNGSGEAHVMAGSVPVGGVRVEISVAGADFDGEATTVSVATDAMGAAAFAITLPSADEPSREVTVVASVDAPAPAQVYRGAPPDVVGQLPQTLITSGGLTKLTATATVELLAPTTTTTTTTTTTPTITTTTTSAPLQLQPETTVPETTVPETTVPETTGPETTSAPQELQPATTVPETTVPEFASSVPLTAPVDLIVDSPLPTTGPMTAGVAYWATAVLVAGVGVVGAMRRRRDRTAMTDVGRYAE